MEWITKIKGKFYSGGTGTLIYINPMKPCFFNENWSLTPFNESHCTDNPTLKTKNNNKNKQKTKQTKNPKYTMHFDMICILCQSSFVDNPLYLWLLNTLCF